MRIQGFHRCAVVHPDITSKPPALDAATNGLRYTGEGGEVYPQETPHQATGRQRCPPRKACGGAPTLRRGAIPHGIEVRAITAAALHDSDPEQMFDDAAAGEPDPRDLLLVPNDV